MDSSVNLNTGSQHFRKLGNPLFCGHDERIRAVGEEEPNNRIPMEYLFPLGITHQNMPHIQEIAQDPLDHLQECSKQDASRFYRRHEPISF